MRAIKYISWLFTIATLFVSTSDEINVTKQNDILYFLIQNDKIISSNNTGTFFRQKIFSFNNERNLVEIFL